MPILQITPTRKTSQTQTILADDLFPTEQINVSNIAGGSTDFDYSYMTQVARDQYGIDFNNLVASYQQNLNVANEQIIANVNQQLTGQDLYEQETRQILAEANQGLSTGASAITSQNITNTIEQNKQDIIAKGKELSAEAAQNTLDSLETTMQSLFGSVDASGRFKNIVAYEQTAEFATEGLFQQIAADIFAADTSALKGVYDGKLSSQYSEYLREKGIFAISESGQYSLTEYGYQVVDSIINSYSFTDSSTREKYIEKMIDAELGAGSANNLKIDNLDKYNKYYEKYEAFLSDSGRTWRFTSLGLWSGTINEPEIDMYYAEGFDTIPTTSNLAAYYDSADITKLEHYFGNSVYQVGSSTVSIANSNISLENTGWNTSWKKGDNIKITVKDSSGNETTRKVEIARDETIKSGFDQIISEHNLKNGSILLVNGEIYIVTDAAAGKIAGIRGTWRYGQNKGTKVNKIEELIGLEG
jgi:hypothetical protein